MREYVELLENVANLNYDYILSNGHAEAGCNGPHGHKDTPVRNSAHLLIVYLFLVKHGLGQHYLKAANILINYLLDRVDSSESGAIQCMDSDKFDHINGLIGQAWVIEALVYAYKMNNDERLLKAALKLFRTQKYNYQTHLWERIEVDGRNIGYDPTYNHQFWFAASGILIGTIYSDAEIKREIDDFMEYSSKRDFVLDKNSRLKHRISFDEKRAPVSKQIKKFIRKIAEPIRMININKYDENLFENAYHLFDIYGFAIIYENKPEYKLFETEKFRKAVRYALDIDNLNRQCGYMMYVKSKRRCPFNKFFYTYNSPAFEFPYVDLIFGRNDPDRYRELLKNQYFVTGENLDKNNPDIPTFRARSYELVRFLDKTMKGEEE